MSELILLIAENNRDIFYIEQALDLQNFSGGLHVTRGMDEVACYLNGIGIYRDRDVHPIPDLIVLDLSSTESLHILTWIRSVNCSEVPIIGIGTARAKNVIDAAFDLGLNAFVSKEEGFDVLAELILNLEYIRRPQVLSKAVKLPPILNLVTFNPNNGRSGS